MNNKQAQLVQTDDSETNIIIARINSYICATISLTGNLSIIFLVTVWRQRFNFPANSTVVIYVTASAVVFSVNHVLSCPIIHIHENELLIISNGILQNTVIGRITLCIFAFFILYSALNSAASLIMKYLAVCCGSLKYTCKLHAAHGIFCLVAILWTLTFAYATWFKRNLFNDNHGHPLRGRPELYSDMRNTSLTISLALLVTMLICAIIIMLFCSQRIIVKLDGLQDQNHKKIQKRIFQNLLIQTGVPFVLLHLPVILSCTISQFNLIPDIIIENFSLLYAWYPACIPFLVLWNIRKALLSSSISFITKSNLRTIPVQ